MGNLILAWRSARKGKTSTPAVIEFEKDLERNLLKLYQELNAKTYQPMPLMSFVLRDPKTRVISKSHFRDRVVHHAINKVISPIFEKQFIYDSCANQIRKGNLFALRRFDYYKRKVTKNYTQGAFCLKADIKHYFQEVNHEVLLDIIGRKIADEDILWLIKQILQNNSISLGGGEQPGGMPLGNLTSQFFANIYLNELDYFIKHKLKVKYYIRYVDDFVILHSSQKQLKIWKTEINAFLKEKLIIELHQQKSRIIPLSRGIDFIGFRNLPHCKLLRARNIRGMKRKIGLFKEGIIDFRTLMESYQGWQAYAKWANTHKLRKQIKKEIIEAIWDKISFV